MAGTFGDVRNEAPVPQSLLGNLPVEEKEDAEKEESSKDCTSGKMENGFVIVPPSEASSEKSSEDQDDNQEK